jgi:polyisoprenoid-binding protein YceI
MKSVRLLAVLLALPLASFAADRVLKLDPSASFVEVDVGVTIGDFTARLDKYDLRVIAEDKKGVKSTVLNFKFADLKTGEPERDQKMLEWLGGGDPAGKFESGIVALTPDGQGRVNGRLTFHGKTDSLEFPVNVTKAGNVFTITGEAMVDYRHFDLKVIRKAGLIKVDPNVKVRFQFTGTPGDIVPPATPPAK